MWATKLSFIRLIEDGRWKVEFFSSTSNFKIKSKYPLSPLKEIVQESKRTIDPQTEPNLLFNYLSLEHVESLTGDLVGFSPKYGSKILSRSKIFRKGAVLYSRLRPYLNKVYLADGEVTEGICSGEFYVLEVDKKRILPRYLRAILASTCVLENITRFQSGAALPRIPIKDLLNMKIPVPPLDHQKKIDTFLKRSDFKRRELRAKLDILPKLMMNHIEECIQKGDVSKLVPI